MTEETHDEMPGAMADAVKLEDEALLLGLLRCGLEEDAAVRAELAARGGWSGLCAQWGSAGGPMEAFARLWSLSTWMIEDAVLLGDRMNLMPEAISGFAGRVQAMALTGMAAEAEQKLAEFCQESAEAWAEVGAADLAESWAEHAALLAQGRLAQLRAPG